MIPDEVTAETVMALAEPGSYVTLSDELGDETFMGKDVEGDLFEVTVTAEGLIWIRTTQGGEDTNALLTRPQSGALRTYLALHPSTQVVTPVADTVEGCTCPFCLVFE